MASVPSAETEAGAANGATAITSMTIAGMSSPTRRFRMGSVSISSLPGKSDRKSTRLNSSHVKTSYAVFCLKPTRTPVIDTLSLHDALPICARSGSDIDLLGCHGVRAVGGNRGRGGKRGDSDHQHDDCRHEQPDKALPHGERQHLFPPRKI